MSLGQLSRSIPALEQTYVALDLETTGLDADRERIIQVGAVKFQGDRVIDTFDTFVNPGRPIPDFIQRLTGIRPEQVSRAPAFTSVRHDLGIFIGGHPVIGHNIAFDLRFLDTEGLNLTNASYDTWDLAAFLLPRNPEYNLVYLARQFGLTHRNAHQALDDAEATRQLFLSLLSRAAELDPALLAYVRSLAPRSRWAITGLLTGLAEKAGEAGAVGRRDAPAVFGLNGLNLDYLATRLGRPERRRYDDELQHLDEGRIVQLLGAAGPFARNFSKFEQRQEQTEMLAAVARTIYQGGHLIVEGGTGVGKSMAYLLPAALYAASRNRRVVISTNTINLQEQLINKDIPDLVKVLEETGVVEPGLIKATLLKGRTNYLCLHRWNYLSRNENLSADDTRLLSKTAVWLQDTVAGDRGELTLSGRDAWNWNRVSAGERGRCPNFQGSDGPCFLRSSREKAEQAHIVVVNHALLLSDLLHGGSIIPDYQHVIIDEAHNLEDAATNQFSFQVGPDRLAEDTEPLTRLTNEVRLALAGEGLAAAHRQSGEQRISEAEEHLPRLRESWTALWAAAELFFNAQRSRDNDLRITPPARSQRSWADLTLAWESVDVGLNRTGQSLARLQNFLEATPFPPNGAAPAAGLITESDTIQGNLEQLREQLAAILGRADATNIHWLHRDTGNRGELTFHSAPLEVGPILHDQLYSKKESVVLTSATLTTQGSFDFARQRLGLNRSNANPPDAESGAEPRAEPGIEVRELPVGSPFNYPQSALLLIPEDMPEPRSQGYYEAVARTLIDLGRTLSGRTMALFTANAAIRRVSDGIRPALAGAGIQVLAQGVDGSAQQVARRFTENHRDHIPTVLLGTSSFWEGVDFSGVLKALVITQLPFPVPTAPVFAARSELYGSNAFNQYAVPLAALRFRQGFGRLIRRKDDSGVVVVLDSRIAGRSYGKAFIESIPQCARYEVNLPSVSQVAGWWLKEANRGTGR